MGCGACGRKRLTARVQPIDAHLPPQPSIPNEQARLPRTITCPLINTPHTYITCIYLGPIHDELTRIDQLPYPIALQHVSPQGYRSLQVKTSGH